MRPVIQRYCLISACPVFDARLCGEGDLRDSINQAQTEVRAAGQSHTLEYLAVSIGRAQPALQRELVEREPVIDLTDHATRNVNRATRQLQAPLNQRTA